MASVEKDLWTPCAVLQLRRMSKEELKKVLNPFTKKEYIKRIIGHYRDIRYKDGLVISDLDTFIKIVDVLIDDNHYKELENEQGKSE